MSVSNTENIWGFVKICECKQFCEYVKISYMLKFQIENKTEKKRKIRDKISIFI